MTPMLATTYTDQRIAGWWMAEKFDGVRALWTGSRLVSRNGNSICAPAWFTDGLPQGLALDGELWMGRGTLQQTAAALRRKSPPDSEWRRMRFLAFDAPAVPGGFETRIDTARSALCVPFASVVDHLRCRGPSHAEKMLAAVMAQGGEGIVLRKPGSRYCEGRSGDLLKHKPVGCAEATVVEYLPGAGRLAGKLGALGVDWNGQRFRLGAGLSDDDRVHPPAIGSKVTFEFNGNTDTGIPRCARFVAVRNYE
jgi:DNA ligase-1